SGARAETVPRAGVGGASAHSPRGARRLRRTRRPAATPCRPVAATRLRTAGPEAVAAPPRTPPPATLPPRPRGARPRPRARRRPRTVRGAARRVVPGLVPELLTVTEAMASPPRSCVCLRLPPVVSSDVERVSQCCLLTFACEGARLVVFALDQWVALDPLRSL